MLFKKYWLPVLLWMGVIFVMSTDLGGAEHTSRIIEPILRWLNPQVTAETIERVHFLVRKGGHLTEYAVLALLVRRAFFQTRTDGGGNGARILALTLLVTAAYAATDEFHQSFVPGRTAAVGDVLIDTSGGLIALTAATLWRIARPKRPAATP